MHSTYDQAMIRGVFPHEGGYTNDAADPGGPTNWGITIIDARKYWKPNATAADVRTMPKGVAEDIYAKHYAAPMRYDDLPAGVDYSVLDYGINSGIGRSGKVLRRVCGLPDSDWHVTPDVLTAVDKRDPQKIIDAIDDERLRFLKSLKTWPNFGAGWGRRVNEVRALSHSFAKDAPLPVISNAAVIGKGAVPAPVGLKSTVKAGTPSAAGAAALTWQQWVALHPWETAAIGCGVAVAIGGAIYLINRHHQMRQEAPTPGLVPVPVAA